MGSPATEEGRDNDETLHRVTFSQPFYLAKYEVTQGQWEAVMGSNPSHFSACGATCPVEQWGVGGRASVYHGVEPAGGRGDVPAADGGRVGVCGAGGNADGVPLRERGASAGAVWVV